MKTIYLILSLLMISLFLNAQSVTNDAVVAAVNMNVLYRGMDNPVAIAAPGVKSERVDATISNGTIKKNAQGWVVEPGSQALSIITVLVDNKKVTEKTFRVMNVPDPVAVFAWKNEGEILKETALSTQTLESELKDFNWDIKFVISSFSLVITWDGYVLTEHSNGNKLTDEMRSRISKCLTGQKIVFQDIKAVGLDGKTRDLSPITLTLK